MTEDSEAFLEKVARYLGDEAPASSEKCFRQWFRDAIGLWITIGDPSSFAPFDDRFRNQREPVENFRRFLEEELLGLDRIGRRRVQGLISEVLRGFLAGIGDPGSPFVVNHAEMTYTSRTAVDIFKALHSVDRDQAVDWFCRYLSLWRSGTHQRDSRERALPVVLFQASHDFSSTDDPGAALASAMFDWCRAHSTEKGVSQIVIDVLCLRLAAISRTGLEQKKRNEALRVMGDFSDPESGSGLTMLEALAAGLDGLPDAMERWDDARAKLRCALVGIDLNGARPIWAERSSTVLFDGLPWTDAPLTERDARREPARRPRGMLERLETSTKPNDRSGVRPELLMA